MYFYKGSVIPEEYHILSLNLTYCKCPKSTHMQQTPAPFRILVSERKITPLTQVSQVTVEGHHTFWLLPGRYFIYPQSTLYYNKWVL